jgi:diguanylate cyclase (GGDEF)-like protein/PAS domain S-box-containing protein
MRRPDEGYALAVRAAGDGIWEWDLAADTLHLSERWHAILGRAAAGCRHEASSAWFDRVHPADLPGLRSAIDDHVAGRTPHLQAEHRMRHADGSWRWVLARGLVTRDADGRPTGMAGSLSDVTDRRRAQLRLDHGARSDALTRLPNRSALIKRVERALQDPRAGCAVLLLDVDRFKLVNESLGHDVGDSFLVALAARVAGAIGPGDALARLGADEFAILLEKVSGRREAMAVADGIRAALQQPFDVGGHELFVTVGIGIALAEQAGGAADLIGNADIAMYAAKRRGRGRCAFFEAAMRHRAVDRLSLEHRLREVVDGARLAIHYQPIIRLSSGELGGLEALARWPEARRTVEPAKFISIAEDTGMIGALGRQVLQSALRALAGWRREGLIGDEVSMSVNLSPRQLDDPALADDVLAAVASASVPATALKLEITESTLIAEEERSRQVFDEICAEGIGLQLDDFGTGYSSLAALHQFPFDALKIDRSFVAGLTDPVRPTDVIVASTITMAHSLGLPVIAEGIERPAQLARLQALGCDFGQGHLFSPALPADEMRALLARWSCGAAAAAPVAA